MIPQNAYDWIILSSANENSVLCKTIRDPSADNFSGTNN